MVLRTGSPLLKLLTILFEQDILKDHTADILKKEYKQFAKYSNRMLSSVLTTLQRETKEIETRKLCGSS
eukprot:13206927-Ditylum_brightwellii.AAC.1